MDSFVWSQQFETGIDDVDQQHHRLVELINGAAPLLADPGGADADILNGLADELVKYADYHFRTEEELMERTALDPAHILMHRRAHRDFVDDVHTLRQNGGGQPADSLSLLHFLTSWLAYHILGVDKVMAAQVQAIEAGMSASAAAAAASPAADAGAVKPLLEALTGLYRVVSSRIRTLKATVEQLRVAESELREANLQLEAKVAARTAELGAEKDHLAAVLEKMERTQSQLLQSEKMASVGQLAAGVAHEINNPVGFVSSNLGTLKTYVDRLLTLVDAYAVVETRLADDPVLQRQICEAREKADLAYLREDIVDLVCESQEGLGRVRRIVSDLKDFSHVDEAEWQDADLNAGLESTLNVVWNELKYKAEIVRKFGELPPVRCIAAQINQVLMNLLINAAQAIDSRGTITLTTRSDGDDAIIEIADTGSGIPPAIQARIFEPFFTTKPVGKGTGLGLSIAWEIIEKHGGRISVDSAPGTGTRFTLRLPIAGGAAAAGSAAAAGGTVRAGGVLP